MHVDPECISAPIFSRMLRMLPSLVGVGINSATSASAAGSSSIESCLKETEVAYQILHNGSDTIASRGDTSMLHTAGPWGVKWVKMYASTDAWYTKEHEHMEFEHNPAW